MATSEKTGSHKGLGELPYYSVCLPVKKVERKACRPERFRGQRALEPKLVVRRFNIPQKHETRCQSCCLNSSREIVSSFDIRNFCSAVS